MCMFFFINQTGKVIVWQARILALLLARLKVGTEERGCGAMIVTGEGKCVSVTRSNNHEEELWIYKSRLQKNVLHWATMDFGK